MRLVFADADYWIALSNPRDALHNLAIKVPTRLSPHRVVTSEMVLVEVLNIFQPRARILAAPWRHLCNGSSTMRISIWLRKIRSFFVKRSRFTATGPIRIGA